MVTIKMIARKCGFSVSTVSKALNGASDISAETAEHIRKIADEMGYMPNSAARALKTTRTHCFGVLFEDDTESGLTHEYFSRILNSFKRRSEELGYDILFISSRLGSREVTYTEHARYRNCDGVLIASVNYADQAVRELVSCGIPVVTIDYEFNDCGSVMSDNIQGMKDLLTHIHGLGHRKIAFIHGEDTAVTRLRIASFYCTCRGLGIEIPEEYVVAGSFHDSAASAAITRQLLQLKDPPTCILYPDDFSYIGGMNECERQGISIPDDICAAGYDGIRLSQMLRPRLTTLRQDAEMIGTSAAEELVRAVEEGKFYIPGRIMVPGKVLPGDTVAQI